MIFCNNTDLGVLPPTFSSLSHYHLSSIPLENLPSNFCAVFLINPRPSAFCHFKLKMKTSIMGVSKHEAQASTTAVSAFSGLCNSACTFGQSTEIKSHLKL